MSVTRTGEEDQAGVRSAEFIGARPELPETNEVFDPCRRVQGRFVAVEGLESVRQRALGRDPCLSYAVLE